MIKYHSCSKCEK